ncbi:MAG: DNA gyrase/topoisomerase IV, partial [Edafosvirus sp.]
NSIKITELPVGLWTDSYLEFLESIVVIDSKNPKKKELISSYKNMGGNNSINIVITFSGNNLKQLLKSDNLVKKLKLTKTINSSNMYLYNQKGVMTK